MAKKDLLAQAEKLGIEATAKMTVAELEAALNAHDDPNKDARVASRENPCPVCGRRNPHVHA